MVITQVEVPERQPSLPHRQGDSREAFRVVLSWRCEPICREARKKRHLEAADAFLPATTGRPHSAQRQRIAQPSRGPAGCGRADVCRRPTIHRCPRRRPACRGKHLRRRLRPGECRRPGVFERSGLGGLRRGSRRRGQRQHDRHCLPRRPGCVDAWRPGRYSPAVSA
jgi:hypothetical protein